MAPKFICPGPLGAPPPAVPVRDAAGRKLPVEMIRYFARLAIAHAQRNPGTRFKIIAKGYGYPDAVIAPMFDYAPMNVHLPYEFMY